MPPQLCGVAMPRYAASLALLPSLAPGASFDYSGVLLGVTPIYGHSPSSSFQWVFLGDGSCLTSHQQPAAADHPGGSDAGARDAPGASAKPASPVRSHAPAGDDHETCWLLAVKLAGGPDAVHWLEQGSVGSVYTLW